jgi:Ribosomal protein L11 methyltransferase (PrmA)
MKQTLVRAIEGLPGIGPLYRELERRLFFRYVKRIRTEAGAKLAAATNYTVERGIFTGMKLHPQSSFGVDQFTMLTGQYESELYGIVAQAAAKQYEAFIDVGCANGFYAVGFALISKDCNVIAYDIDERSRTITALNAELNDVPDRISIKDKATHAELDIQIERYKTVFLLVDIEGGEIDLLDPSECPALLKCDLLIEVHGRTDEVAEILRQRFCNTHKSTIVPREPRNPFQFNGLPCTFEDEAWVVVSEGRNFTRNNWLFLQRNPH